MDKVFSVVAQTFKVQQVQAALLKHQAAGLGIADIEYLDPGAAGRAAPAIPVGHQQHALALLPFVEYERAGADGGVRLPAEALTGGLGGLGVQYGSARCGQAGQEGRIGLG